MNLGNCMSPRCGLSFPFFGTEAVSITALLESKKVDKIGKTKL